MADQAKGANGSVFISYSRKDKEFVKKLNDALDQAGIHAWVDWEGIELASDWMARITSAIQGSNAFLFVMTSDSLKSKVCTDELELAIKYNKKIIPVLYRDPAKSSKIHPKLSSTNWVYLRKKDDFDGTIPRLIESVNTDLEWVSQHTRLLERATEWEVKNQNGSYLLQGSDLEDAERWMAEASGKENRTVVPIQAQYIMASRTGAVRRQRMTVIGISLALVVSIALSIWAIFANINAQKAEQQALIERDKAQNSEALAIQKQEEADAARAEAIKNQERANQEENIANARRSAAESQVYQNRPGELDTSMLLAIDSYQRDPTPEAESLMRRNIGLLPIPIVSTDINSPHTSTIWNIEWSPDNTNFVTAGNDGKACVWRIADGDQLYCVTHPSVSKLFDAVFSKDGKYLITGSEEGNLYFWNAADGKELDIEPKEYGATIWDMDVSPNGKYLAVGRKDNRLMVFELNNLKLAPLIFDLQQRGGVWSVEFSDDGKWLASGTMNGFVHIWQVNTGVSFYGARHQSDTGYLGDYTITAFSPDSSFLASVSGDSMVRVTKTVSGGQFYSVLHGDWVEDVEFGRDGSWFVTASDDKKVRVFDTASGAEKIRMEHLDLVQRVEVSPDGNWIASTGYDDTVRIWDSASGGAKYQIPLENDGSALSFNHDGTRIVTTDDDGNMGIWDISELSARTGYIEFPEYLHEARYAPSGEWIVINSDDNKIRVFAADQVNEIHKANQGAILSTSNGLTYNVAVSMDAQWIALVERDPSNEQNNTVMLISADGNTEFNLTHPGGAVSGVAFSPDGALIAAASRDSSEIVFWNTQTGAKTESIQITGLAEVFSIAISPNGKWLAVGSDNRVEILDFENKTPSNSVPMLGDIQTLTFSNDSQILATGSSRSEVVLLNGGDGSFSEAFSFETGGVPLSLAFNPEDKILAVGSEGNYVYLWDLEGKQEVSRLLHSDAVTGVAFSPDGKQLSTVSRKVVQFWDLALIRFIQTSALESQACSRLTKNFNADEWASFFGNEEAHPICLNLPVSK